MKNDGFMEKLVSHASLDTIDFACDLERALADEVKYLRRVIAAYGETETIEREGRVRELRARLIDKDVQIAQLLEENRFLREIISTRGLK